MKTFLSKITLNKNGRGCYILDTVKGCQVCRDEKPMGCYDNCYALNIANRYQWDFGETTKREFTKEKNQCFLFDVSDQDHLGKIIKEIKNIDMPFVRIGEMGDPSYDWEHTLDVCQKISIAKKPIVIITKHWKKLTQEHLDIIKKLDICINTSISALDENHEIHDRLIEYERLKQYCKSVLRVVTCDFNTNNKKGIDRQIMQEFLLRHDNILETVFRPSKENSLVLDGVINVGKVKFLGTTQLASMRTKNQYIGYCNTCPDMCGINQGE